MLDVWDQFRSKCPYEVKLAASASGHDMRLMDEWCKENCLTLDGK